MKTHELKINPIYFSELEQGHKTFELRKNDRNFEVGDQLVLSEYEGIKNPHYTGYEVYAKIVGIFGTDKLDKAIMRHMGVELNDYVILSIEVVDELEEE